MAYLKINRDELSLRHKYLIKMRFPEEITDYQADMMLHALGADNRPFKKYRKNKYYHAYRNHYDAGGSDIEAWDDLVAKGYAEKQRCYHVTVRGIHLLEHLTQCRIWDDCDCTADCRHPVLERLMRHHVSCGYGCWIPLSSADLSVSLAIPRKLILETLRELAEDGIVVKSYYGEMDDEGTLHCHHGWVLTKQAQEKYAEDIKKFYDEEVDWINKSLDQREGDL